MTNSNCQARAHCLEMTLWSRPQSGGRSFTRHPTGDRGPAYLAPGFAEIADRADANFAHVIGFLAELRQSARSPVPPPATGRGCDRHRAWPPLLPGNAAASAARWKSEWYDVRSIPHTCAAGSPSVRASGRALRSAARAVRRAGVATPSPPSRGSTIARSPRRPACANDRVERRVGLLHRLELCTRQARWQHRHEARLSARHRVSHPGPRNRPRPSRADRRSSRVPIARAAARGRRPGPFRLRG